MSDAAAIVADTKHAIGVLTRRDDPAAVRVAAVLERWLAGQTFDVAAGLLPGWRSHHRLTARDRALESLVKMHADMKASQLATWILASSARLAGCTDGVRPGGADGYVIDLLRAECSLSWRQWRRLIADIRRGWPSLSLNGQDD